MPNPPRKKDVSGYDFSRAVTRRTCRHLLPLLLSPLALALNPSLDVSQYAHTAWKYRDGFTKGEISDIAQTPDGYLWFATQFGLYRFDGTKPAPWQPPPDQSGKPQPLPSDQIQRVLGARDGTLWIGTRNGLASWKNGKLTRYPELSGFIVSRLLEDREGSIWVGARELPLAGKLCEIRNATVRCSPETGGVVGLHEDGKGNLWVGTFEGVWRWKPTSQTSPPQFYPLHQPGNGIQGMADDRDGALLISVTGGISRFVDGKPQMAYPYPAAMRAFHANNMFRDRDGGLWVGPIGSGIVHVHQGRTDVFSPLDGLTGNDFLDLFEDREHNIWVATPSGLDRFRELPVITYSLDQGLSSRPSGAILGARDGSIWIATIGELNRLSKGQWTVYRSRSAVPRPGVREVAIAGLPDRQIVSLYEDSRGRIWVSSQSGVGYIENDRFISTDVPGGIVHAIAEDAAANIWIANQDLGLFRLSPDNEVQQMLSDLVIAGNPVTDMAADPSGSGIWLGFFKGGLAWFSGGNIRASYSASDGLGAGRVNQLRFDKQGALWAATDGGLSRLKDGRITTLTAKNGLPCDAVHWAIEDDAQSVWIKMPCGLARVPRSELDVWAASEPRPRGSGLLHPTVFDTSDGITLVPTAGGFTPHVAKSSDGKLWFWNADGIGMVDPGHLPFNNLPPPVQIETVKIDGNARPTAAAFAVPHSVRDIEIDYTALSFTNPDRMQFRYKLEGYEKDWQDVGTRRQAYYTNLSPKQYRFRVMASNNDGVWNEAGASWTFSVTPAFYQTYWFLALCAVAGAGMLWLLYRLRLHQVTHRMNLRMEERVNERTRIARDLHDTLLQSFQGVLLKFSAARFMLPSRPAEAGDMLDGVIEQARAAIAEGRDAVQGLRSSTLINNDLAQAITVFGDGLCADRAGQDCPGFRVQVEGASRDLVPLVRDEIYKIAIESLRNAFRHSHAKQIEVEIHYQRRQLRMRVRDNGKGIDQEVLNEGGRKGHHGLPGMHERAKLVGGKLNVWSKPDLGTEVDLTVPGSIAYAKSSAAHQPAVLSQRT
jgi:signal transduction histidine kinase/ligand-binding sensor domain-containing protein